MAEVEPEQENRLALITCIRVNDFPCVRFSSIEFVIWFGSEL